MRRATASALAWALLASVLVGAGEAPAPEPDAFEQLLQTAQANPRGASEEQIKQLIAEAQSRGRVHAVALVVKSHLSQNFQATAVLLRLAADNALLAGDLRTAVARYKACLTASPDDAKAPQAAASLYTVLTGFLGDDDDAYQFIGAHGEKLSRSVTARKFDTWYIEQARRRNDCPALARMLLAVLSQKLPLEQERLYYWESLDWLMAQVAKGRKEHFDALPFCRQLVPLVRGSKPRSLRYALQVAQLDFKTVAAGKDEATLDATYGPVVSAARAYFDAYPSVDTLRDIIVVLTDGRDDGHFDDAAWQRQQKPKSAFILYAFGKLKDADREALLNLRFPRRMGVAGALLSREQWADVGAKHAALFRRCEGTRSLPLLTRPDSRDLFKKQAAFLQGVASRDAAAINAMAASSDLTKVVDRLLQQEAWHLTPADVWRLIDQTLWQAHYVLGEKAKKRPSNEERHKMLVHYGVNYLAKTAAGLDRDAVRAYIDAAWQSLGDDKSKMVDHLRSIQWVPFKQRERKDIFSHTYGGFRNWASWVRREIRKPDSKIKPQVAQSITAIEEAFRKAMNPTATDPNAASNPLCKALSLALLAEQSKDTAGFVRQARALYPMVRDYQAKKVPCGRFVVGELLKNRNYWQFDISDFQAEVVAQELKALGDREPDERVTFVADTVVRDPHGRGWWNSQKQVQQRILKLNTLFEKAVTDRLAKGTLSPTLFDWFRGTRQGDHWREPRRGQDVMAKIIEGKLLHKTDYRPYGDIPSATVSYMKLVRDEFPGLNSTYPVERYFDDMFVDEATRTKRLDWRYWDYARDGEKKIVNVAAKLLAGYATLPFDTNGKDVVCSRSDFWNWQHRAVGAEQGLRDALIAKAEQAFGKTRFDTFAMGRAYFNTQADASSPKGRDEFFKRVSAYLERVRQAPVRLAPPYLGQLERLDKKVKLTKDELGVLVSIFPDCAPTRWPGGWHFERMASMVARGLVEQKRETELYGLIPHLWRIARDTGSGDLLRELSRLAADLASRDLHDLALTCSETGLAIVKTALPDEARGSLVAVRSKSLGNIGGVIPVKRDDRRYPIYASQAAYLGGRLQSGWDLYVSRRTLVAGLVKELDPTYCMWLIDRHTELREFDAAESLARTMIQWFDSVADGFQPETRARLLLSYANIALERREYPRARALFERIGAAQEFQGTRARGDAELKVAEVDRLTGRYDQATKILEKLSRSKDPALQAESYYGMALVSFDQEEYREALDSLDQVFARVPDHSNAKILEARAKVKMRKLEEPTEIQIGTVTRRRFIVPGKPLKVSLEDRNLAVVGTSSDIEIRAWTKSGDEEVFSLMPFGDSKTRFRGALPTVLGPPEKGDRTLQVLGNDTVHYDFSDRFKTEHKIALSAPETLTVTTDAELLISSGRILTKEEREARALEDLIRKRLGDDAEEEEEEQVALSTIRREDQIKPGNKFNVRVIDPDRGNTPGKDKLNIRIGTSSGDSIAALAVEETDTHSGVFEGTVQTASGQAIAFASDSDDRREPNHVISKKQYIPWVALPDNQRPKTFSIDLNDNVALGKMIITANVPGRKLKTFLVQTSLNAQDFTTVGSWPKAFKPWDGSPVIELVRHGKENRAPANLAAFIKFLTDDYIREDCPKFALKAAVLAERFDQNVKNLATKMGLAGDREGSWYIIHHYAAFYQPARRIRTFQVEPKGLPKEPKKGDRSLPTYILTVDGQAGKDPLQLRRSLGKGVHRIDLYVCATRKANPQYEVRMDIDKPPFMAACPADLFDVAKHPQIPKGVAVPRAKVTANDDKSKFELAFDKEARARVVRLFITDFETDAPAIDKITLTAADGKTILPTEQDFMTLRDNQVLEIVPGDRVTVSYEDPRVITEGKEHHEAFLTATFSNATISACFVEYTVQGDGERKARYIPMRRFKPGDKINVFISDPDCDISDKPDQVTFVARTSDGKPIELPALETEEHSGVFVGGVFPVNTDPKRKSELKVIEGDDIIITYVDQDNTDPGIPWNRACVVEQTWYEAPQVRVFSVESQPLAEDELPPAADGPQTEEMVPVTRSLVATWPPRPDVEKPTPVLIGGPLLVEVVFPFIAQSPESECTVYVQTASGRKAYGKAPEGVFDIKVPGTQKLVRRPSNSAGVKAPPGYKSVLVRGNPLADDALDDGRFSFLVPFDLATLPEESLAMDDQVEDKGNEPAPALAIKGDDRIFIGFEFADDNGARHWVTREVILDADSFFDVMDRRYRETVSSIYVGESAYFRVIDATRDTTDEKDDLVLSLKASSGAAKTIKLTEAFTHGGVFKGHVRIAYHGDEAEAKDPEVLPVKYGDTIAASYKRPTAEKGFDRTLTVFKGSDGSVLPFTKRFKDPAIAVQTQFTIAEAYFEMAKRHRALGQDSLARREILQGKKLLEEAIRDYPDTEARAQADYLLAELSLEFANDTKNEEMQKKHYAEAVARFTDIVATYPDSPYAPKAQYKKALVFEKMGQIDQACEEYVKLSYRYPDNELVAETIARLGQYFLTKGKGQREKAEKTEDKVEAEKIEMQAVEMYKTSGQVFGRLAVRFPNHRLAGKTLVLSAQCYMQAKDLAKAAEVFQAIIKAPKMDNDLVAESMYWCGDCYMRQDDYVNAYRSFKKLSWDYPASKWAKFARGRLSEESLADIADKDDE